MISLQGKKGLITGIANDRSIALGCARAFREAGAELAVTYLNDKALPHVELLAAQLEAPLLLPLDVREETQIEAVFNAIDNLWGKLDFALHSIAFAPKEDLHGRVTDCSRGGFLTAMDISCYSFMRMAHHAEPLMKGGGCLLTTSYYGSERVVEHYGIMGPVKAALEASVKYLAAELGGAGIRVNALSPGPILTRAANGIAQFDAIMTEALLKSPQHEGATIDDVGAFAAFLASDAARHITGTIHPIDCGYHIIA